MQIKIAIGEWGRFWRKGLFPYVLTSLRYHSAEPYVPFAFPENHEIWSLALSALGWCHQGTSVNYINELQYFLISFLFVKSLFHSFDILKFEVQSRFN